MAVIDEHPGLRVEIHVDKKPLQEYNDEEEEHAPNAVTKYIEAQSGCAFTVRFWLEAPFSPQNSVLAMTTVDGKPIAWTRAVLGKFYAGGWIVSSVHIDKGEKCYVANLAFSELNTDDSDINSAAPHVLQDLKGVGEISLQFHYIKNIRTIPTDPSTGPSKNWNKQAPLAGLGTIPEKALKGNALSHQTTWKNLKEYEPRANNQTRTTWDWVDPARERGTPFASFKFLYRSRGALKALLIIPCSPSPAPLEDRDSEILSLKAEHVKKELKRERSDTEATEEEGDDDDVQLVRQTKRAMTRHVINVIDAEVIDLT